MNRIQNSIKSLIGNATLIPRSGQNKAENSARKCDLALIKPKNQHYRGQLSGSHHKIAVPLRQVSNKPITINGHSFKLPDAIKTTDDGILKIYLDSRGSKSKHFTVTFQLTSSSMPNKSQKIEFKNLKDQTSNSSPPTELNFEFTGKATEVRTFDAYEARKNGKYGDEGNGSVASELTDNQEYERVEQERALARPTGGFSNSGKSEGANTRKLRELPSPQPRISGSNRQTATTTSQRALPRGAQSERLVTSATTSPNSQSTNRATQGRTLGGRQFSSPAVIPAPRAFNRSQQSSQPIGAPRTSAFRPTSTVKPPVSSSFQTASKPESTGKGGKKWADLVNISSNNFGKADYQLTDRDEQKIKSWMIKSPEILKRLINDLEKSDGAGPQAAENLKSAIVQIRANSSSF